MTRRVTVACSPDADDLFMMRALMLGAIDTPGLAFEISTDETDRLNRLAGPDGPQVSAISIAWYPSVAERYQLLPHGGSAGEGYGPALIAPAPRPLASLEGARIAVPGTTTTAFAVLSKMVASFDAVVIPIVPAEAVFDALHRGEVDAAVVIHEGRLVFEERGFGLIEDLGSWWAARTGHLLPLGGNVIRRDLGPDVVRRVSAHLRDSIAHALDHRDDAIEWLLARGGVLGDRARIDRYLAMYANARTLDWGPDGRRAIVHLLGELGYRATVDFAP